MKINLITGATTYEAGINTIKKIDVNNLEQRNIIVVPDSFSLQAENLLFDLLGIKSTFNIEVVGISRLASKLLRENNIGFKRISSLEEIFNIYKAVKESQDQFLYFKSSSVDFCIKLLQLIKQFKGCKISPKKLKLDGDSSLALKMHDISIVYEKFQILLEDKLDLSKLLEFFVENSEDKLDLSKTKLYFVNFDSFSLEINSFVCKLAQFSQEIFIGMARPLSQNNAYIYEDDIFKKTTVLAKENLIPVSVENKPTLLKDEKLILAKNLFGIKIEKGKSNCFWNILAKNKLDEIEFIAKYIKKEIFEGKKFRDFAIAVSDEKYYEIIKKVFSDFDIAFYCDEAVDLSNTILGRFLLKMFEMSKLGFDKSQFEFLANSPLVFDDAEMLKKIRFYEIEDEKEFQQIFPETKSFINLIFLLKSCKRASDFEKVLKNFIDIVSERFEKIVEELQQKNYLKKHSENVQSKQLIFAVLEKLSELGGEENFSILDFEQLFKLALKSVKVETIPSYIDAVFVGNATTSYFEDVDTLCVVGGNNLPKQHKDVAIIDDEEIAKLKINFALEPEIRVLNRRSRLKIFELLQHWKSKLIIMQPTSEEGTLIETPNFVKDILEMFGGQSFHTQAWQDFNLAIETPEEEFDRLLMSLGTREKFSLEYSKLKDKLPYQFVAEVESMMKKDLSVSELTAIKNPIKPTKISASALETYFACPFKYFMRYCLNVVEEEKIAEDKRKFGSFQHLILERFLAQNKFDQKSVDCFIKENLEECAKEIYDKKILGKPYFIKFLANESAIILKNIVKERELSSFTPMSLEERISTPLSNNVDLIGFIDRVDTFGKYFRIIDYKTGRTKNLTKELFYGKKLQLFLYANAIKQKTGLLCAGVYYFDCQTKYTKQNSQTKLLKGLTLKDNDVVENTDKKLIDDGIKSELLGMERKKNVKDGEFAFKYGNVVENFDELFNYAKEVSLQAIKEINEGFIQPKPFKDECKFCPYISICRQRGLYRNVLKEGEFKEN